MPNLDRISRVLSSLEAIQGLQAFSVIAQLTACGSGMHPGGDAMRGPGRLAARQTLNDRAMRHAQMS
ncbi:MAG: hypothetical protein GY809_20235 [Planctomycetes bacterium]|nr:hypothetical protein [Planctomycetota bacterium]